MKSDLVKIASELGSASAYSFMTKEAQFGNILRLMGQGVHSLGSRGLSSVKSLLGTTGGGLRQFGTGLSGAAQGFRNVANMGGDLASLNRNAQFLGGVSNMAGGLNKLRPLGYGTAGLGALGMMSQNNQPQQPSFRNYLPRY